MFTFNMIMKNPTKIRHTFKFPSKLCPGYANDNKANIF